LSIPLVPRALEELARRYGGRLENGVGGTVARLVPTPRAGAGDLTVLLHARYVGEAARAVARGAALLADEPLASRLEIARLPAWTHAHAAWAMAEILEHEASGPPADAVVAASARVAPGVHVLPGVRVGERVTIAPGAVIGAPGFGWVTGADGRTRAVPQLGGVVVEDDVQIGALCTIAAGTIGPTILRRGAKLDAQVHVGHNCEVGEGTVIAAQTGLAGSVVIGRGVLIGGQVGVADHLHVGDGARLAAKSGVIGDVAPGTTVAGYPAVERQRWLRGLASLYRSIRRGEGG
jgi:UDP-3-O-[3-hydroxymyristoyl] glucosamine N-acyltransferase